MAATDVLTLAEAKQQLNLSGTTAYDTELPLWISGISERLDALIGPIVRRTISNELHDGGYHTIYLRHYPIRAITTVIEYNWLTPLTLAPESNPSKPADAYLTEAYEMDRTLISQRIRRRYGGITGLFVPGKQNVVCTYEAGRVDNTASVSGKIKIAAGVMLQNAWRSQEISTSHVGEFDVPASNFPRFAVPRFVRDMFTRELQEPRINVL